MSLLESFLAFFRKPPLQSPTPAPATRAEEPSSSLGKPTHGDRETERRHAAQGTRVLIVDDSKTVVVTLRKILISQDYLTLEAFDAESGLEIARTERPDVIFLDIVLPGMNGFAALRHLRSDPLTKSIPIIMMSSNAQATEQFFCGRIGADDFMKKPFAREEVFARLNKLVGEDSKLRRPEFTNVAYGTSV